MHPAALALALTLVVPPSKVDATRHGPDVPGSVETIPPAPVSAGSVITAGVAWHEDEIVFAESGTDAAPATPPSEDTYADAHTHTVRVRVPSTLDGRTVHAVEARF